MITVLKLLYGDKRNPTRTLDLNRSDQKVYLRLGGFAPRPGANSVAWSGLRQTGRRRVSSQRDNAVFELVYHLRGGSLAELAWLQSEINRFVADVQRYEEERAGEPVWLMYTWLPNSLTDLPVPAFGQFYQYMRILDLEPGWPQDLHGGLLNTATAIDRIVLRFTARPYVEGLRQQAGMGIGQLQMDGKGVLIPIAVTNQITNPSFDGETSPSWNNDWTASDTDLKAFHETRGDYARSLSSSAHLANQSASDQTYTQSLTLTVDTYTVSCYARRADGEAVTASDLLMVIAGTPASATFTQVDGGPWYHCYADAAGSAGASTYGVEVQAGREVWIDDVQVALQGNARPVPFCSGHLIGCAWSSTAHDSSSSRPDPVIKWTLTDELMGEYTVAGWITTHWANSGPAADLMVFQYYVDANNYVGVYFDYSADRFEIAGVRDGTAFSGNGSAQTISRFQNLHLALVQDTTTLKLYVNGAQDISVNVNLAMPSGGTFRLGNSQAGSQPITAWVDGWRIWRQALTVTQVGALYDAELPIKTAYGSVGQPAFIWTKDGDNVVDNCDDSDQDNWLIVGGVAGDLEAETEWRIDPSASPKVVWLGRKAVDEAFAPGTLYLERGGTADAGSSGGQYEEQTDSAAMLFSEQKYRITDIAQLRGRYQCLARMYVATNSVNVLAQAHLGTSNDTSIMSTDVVAIPTNASILWRALGDLIIDWDDELVRSIYVYLRIKCTPSTGSATVQVDFVQFLPCPAARLSTFYASATFAAGDYINLNGQRAVAIKSGDYHGYLMEMRGDPIMVQPRKYNYVWLLQGEEGQTYDITLTALVNCYVTPRYLLAGSA